MGENEDMASRSRPAAVAGACVAAVVVVAACTPTQRQPRHDPRTADRCDVDVKIAPTDNDADRRVITTLQTRDHEVTVYGGSGGLRFTVSVGETVLAQMLDEHEFSHSFPSLHRHFESAFAQDGWLDATADRREHDVRGAWGGL
jgi:hypothetical protein